MLETAERRLNCLTRWSWLILKKNPLRGLWHLTKHYLQFRPEWLKHADVECTRVADRKSLFCNCHFIVFSICRARKEHVWYKPLPPKADVLPLNVSARTFELSQYLERTSGNRNEFFISAPAEGEAKKISEERVSASKDEITLLKTITGNVLRCVLRFTRVLFGSIFGDF